MRIEFTVSGRPPRKQQTTSMWSQLNEALLVASLRMKALEAMKRAGLNDCFHSFVSLELTLFTPYLQLEKVGDLDTFITGVCDSLQAAHVNTTSSVNPLFLEPQYREIDPKRPLLIENDSKIMSIVAKKKSLDVGQTVYYRVVIEPLASI